MPIKKRPWKRAEKWLIGLTLMGVGALSGWGWFENQATPPRLMELGHVNYSASGLVLSPDQKFVGLNLYVYNGTHTGALKLWDTRSLKTGPSFQWSAQFRQICVSDDAAQVGLLDYGYTSFEWRNRATQQLLWRFVPSKPYESIQRVHFLRKTSQILLLATGYRCTPRNYLISSRSGVIQKQWAGTTYGSETRVVSPDERILANYQRNFTGAREDRGLFLVLRNVQNGHLLRRIRVNDEFSSPLFSPDGRCILVLNAPDQNNPNIRDNTVRCLDVRTGQQLWKFDALSVASDINPWRRRLVSMQSNSNASERLDFVAFSGMAISNYGATVAVMRFIDSTVYLLDAKTGQLQRKLALPLGKAERSDFYAFPNLLFAPDGKHLFTLTNDSIFAWDLTAK